MLRAHGREGLLQERGLARSGAGDQADGIDTRRPEAIAQLTRDDVILLEYVPADFYQARPGAHSSTSNPTTSSSLPCTISVARKSRKRIF